MGAHGVTRKPGQKFQLSRIDPRSTPGMAGPTARGKKEAERDLPHAQERLRVLQQRLHAGGKHAVLVVCQGMDASGKDGLIRHVAGAFDPQGVEVSSFKVPTAEEMAHDFLWRIHKAVPGRGTIGIFNRSHYEDVGVVRVKSLVPEAVWKKRYDQINEFERLLTENGVTLVKLFLHISPDEQAKRLLDRRDDPDEQWKFNPGDLDDRKLWNEFMTAYQDALTRCNTAWAPWHVIPADRKWYRDWVVARLLIATLEGLHLEYPQAPEDIASHEVPKIEWPKRARSAR